MGKATAKRQVLVTTVKAVAIKCPVCPARLVAAPGKNPVKILAGHMKRKHNHVIP